MCTNKQRNLVKNGGILDEVIWLQRTQNQADLAFLDKLIHSEAGYSRVDVQHSDGNYASAYDGIEDDVLYVKVDTDIVRGFYEAPLSVHYTHQRQGIYRRQHNLVHGAPASYSARLFCCWGQYY